MGQIEAVVTDQRGAVGGGKEEFRDVGGPCEAVDRAAAEVEVACDGTKAVAVPKASSLWRGNPEKAN